MMCSKSNVVSTIKTIKKRFVPYKKRTVCSDHAWPLVETTLPRKADDFDLWIYRFPSFASQYKLVHRHPEFEICYCPDDHGSFLINDKEYPIEPGDIFIVNRNEFHQPILKNHGNNGAYVIYFLPQLITDLTQNSKLLDFFLFSSHYGLNRIRGNIKLPGLIEEITEIFYSDPQPPLWKTLCEGILIHILAILAHECAKMSKPDNARIHSSFVRFNRVIKYIGEHLHEKIENEVLYKIAGLSRSQFCRLFKESSGHTVSDYIQRERINRAKSLLRNTSFSVTEIAYASGFNWLGFFNEVFRKHTGSSPGNYRRNLSESKAEPHSPYDFCPK